MGDNGIQLTGTGDTMVDTFILTRVTDRSTLSRLREEQKVVDLYENRKAGQAAGTGNTVIKGITIANLRINKGALHLSRNNEPHGIRINDDGDPLRLRLLTSPLPPTYPKVAEEIAKQWRAVGVDVVVEVPKEKREFEDRVIHRDYDILLFGQPLLDNLDSYPFWHSSQIQVFNEETEESDGERRGTRLDANNLSQFTSFRADALLEQIRETHNATQRKKSLELLRDVFKEEVPAVVLYSPTYVFAVSEKTLGVDLGKLSLHSDRFLSMHRWFIKEGRTFKTGKSWLSFFGWLPSLVSS